jgi:hypothetical protein
VSLNKTVQIKLVAVSFAAITLGLSAQTVPPTTPPAAAANSGSAVGKLDGQQKTEKPKKNQSDSQLISTCDKCVACCPIQQPQAKTNEDALAVLYRRYLWATIIGVCGAIAGLLVLICQTILLRRSANAAKDAAEVAKTNTDALINIERAWLVLEAFDPKGKEFWEISYENAYKANAERTPITVTFKNYGHTPAWLIESAFNLEVSKAKESDFSFEYAEFQKSEGGEPIAPDTEGLPIDVELKPKGFLSAADMSHIEDGQSFLYFYGFIKYKDVFSEQTKEMRETHFCYQLRCIEQSNKRTSGKWVSCGPGGANKNT